MSDEPADWPTGRALLPCDNNTGSGNMSGTKDWGQEERGAVELADAFDRLAEVIGKSAYHPDDRFANTPSKPPTRDEISRASTLINEVDDVCDMRNLATCVGAHGRRRLLAPGVVMGAERYPASGQLRRGGVLEL